MTDKQSNHYYYDATNRLLFSTLKTGILKEKKTISRLAGRERALQARLTTETKQIQSGIYAYIFSH